MDDIAFPKSTPTHMASASRPETSILEPHSFNLSTATADPFKSMRKTRALIIATRGVVGSKFGDWPRLEFAHRDAYALRDYLIGDAS